MSEQIIFWETGTTPFPALTPFLFCLNGMVTHNGKNIRASREVEIGEGRRLPLDPDDPKYKHHPKHIPLKAKVVSPFSMAQLPEWKEKAKIEITNEINQQITK